MHYGQTGTGPTISAIGKVQNNSDNSWSSIVIETRFFDKDGKLIDTESREFYSMTILPHEEAAFRIRTAADKPPSSYVSHKVFVRSAKDPRAWP